MRSSLFVHSFIHSSIHTLTRSLFFSFFPCVYPTVHPSLPSFLSPFYRFPSLPLVILSPWFPFSCFLYLSFVFHSFIDTSILTLTCYLFFLSPLCVSHHIISDFPLFKSKTSKHLQTFCPSFCLFVCPSLLPSYPKRSN